MAQFCSSTRATLGFRLPRSCRSRPAANGRVPPESGQANRNAVHPLLTSRALNCLPESCRSLGGTTLARLERDARSIIFHPFGKLEDQ